VGHPLHHNLNHMGIPLWLIDMFFLQYLKDIEEQFSQKEALSRLHLITEKIKRDLTEK